MLTLRWGKKPLSTVLMSLSLLAGMAGIGNAGTGKSVLNFTATFFHGTCDIAASTGAATITFPPSTPADVTTPAIIGEGIHPQIFNIKFANCSSTTGLVPKLKITGNQITQGAGHALFRNAASTSTGYGVRLINTKDVTGALVPSPANIQNNDLIILGNNVQNLKTRLDGNSVEFTAYLSCGNCTSIAPTPGSLTAAVTFDFLYN